MGKPTKCVININYTDFSSDMNSLRLTTHKLTTYTHVETKIDMTLCVMMFSFVNNAQWLNQHYIQRNQLLSFI